MSATYIPAQQQAQKLFARCFTKEEFEFLQRQPKFMQAAGQLETIEDALNAVELGQQLVRQSWKRVSYPLLSV